MRFPIRGLAGERGGVRGHHGQRHALRVPRGPPALLPERKSAIGITPSVTTVVPRV